MSPKSLNSLETTMKVPSPNCYNFKKPSVLAQLDLLQVSLLINKQTGGKKKKKREGKGEGERDLWTTRFENEARHSLAQV